MTAKQPERRRLDRATMLAGMGVKREDVDTPEIGKGTFFTVRAMTTGEFIDFRKSSRGIDPTDKGDGLEDFGMDGMLKLFHMCVINEDGSQMFAEDPEDIARKFPIETVNRVTTVVMRLSGMTSEEVEELTGKELAAQTSGDSGTA